MRIYTLICACALILTTVTAMEVYRLDLNHDYNATIQLARDLPLITYNEDLMFHAFWSGPLNEKHVISIKSCYQFNIKGRSNRNIVLWVDVISNDPISDTIRRYAQIRQFDFNKERIETPFENKHIHRNPNLSFYSDVVRYILLYKYGGFWFDLDIFFLRSIDPVLSAFGDHIVAYNWGNSNWPNGAIYFNPYPRNPKMEHIINYLIERGQGFGFQESELTYENPVDLFVLPCSWFDAGWIYEPYTFNTIMLDTHLTFNFGNFSNGSFTYHWHNKWTHPIGPRSPFRQLANLLTDC